MLLGQRVHARAGGEVVGRLGAAVQHDHQRHGSGRGSRWGRRACRSRLPAALVKDAGDEPRPVRQGLGAGRVLAARPGPSPAPGRALRAAQRSGRACAAPSGMAAEPAADGRGSATSTVSRGRDRWCRLRPVRGWVGIGGAVQQALQQRVASVSRPARVRRVASSHVGVQGVRSCRLGSHGSARGDRREGMGACGRGAWSADAVGQGGLDRRAGVQRAQHDDRGDRGAGEFGRDVGGDAGEAQHADVEHLGPASRAASRSARL